MDNHFDNAFYGAQPQRPFTEKPDVPKPDAQEEQNLYGAVPKQPEVPQEENPYTAAQTQPHMPEQSPYGATQTQPEMNQPQGAYGYPNGVEPMSAYNFQPQSPFMTKENVATYPQQDYGYNPIQHTATYSYGDAQQPVPPQYQGYYPPVQQVGNPQMPYAPQSYPIMVPTGNAPYEEKKPEKSGDKSKANKALVAVIIILGIMLVASIGAFLWYTIYNSEQNKDSQGFNSHGYSDGGSDFTMPDGDIVNPSPNIPETTEPAVHEESDFSDKIDKNHQGLELKDKPKDAASNKGYNAEYAFKTVSDSVVSIRCFTEEISDSASASSEGSGIIISADGMVVTNAHVIGNSKTAYAIQVVTSDGTKYTAGVVGFDARTDLAVLKLVDAKGLKAATFGDSSKLQLGEDMIIIGNPGGITYQNSMTKGIVSALDRSASNKSIVKYIQTDAAINPGNSGGPAVNVYGQVVGIASAKISSEMYEGMGFCIPSQTAKEIVDSLIKNGYVEGRVKIGISGFAVTSSEAAQYGIPLGIEVDSVDPDGPCGSVGLQSKDIITEFDGISIKSFSDIYEALEGHKPGDKVKLKYYRYYDQKDYEVEITLQEDK